MAGSDRVSSTTEGILYSVSGADYMAETLISARSSLRFNHIPHVAFSDSEHATPDVESGLFTIRPYEPSGDPFADKIRNMASSPFDRSIFLDSDTYVTGDLVHLLDLLDRFDMAAAFAPGYRRREDPEVPQGFYEFNTGMIVWRDNDATRSFFTDWLDTYARLTRERPFATIDYHYGGYEQPAFRRCAWRRDITLCVLGPEYNYRPRRPGSAVEHIHVIHGRYPDHEHVNTLLNGERGSRSFPAIPGGSQEPIARLPV